MMNRPGTRTILGLLAALSLTTSLAGADDPPYDRKEDVIYGRKFGTALTMDVFTPTEGRQRDRRDPGRQRRLPSPRTSRSSRRSSGR